MNLSQRVFLTLLISFPFHLFAQRSMQAATYNFTGFSDDEKMITGTLLKNTPVEFQNHPEFGITPYKTPCDDCVELIQQRDFYSRYYIESDNPGHFYKQQSYFPLHYRDGRGVLRTIDPRLKPAVNQPGVYSAPNQPVPTLYDLNEKKAYIWSGDFLFGFNGNLSMYFENADGGKTGQSAADLSHTTVGESGAYTHGAWQHIDVRQVFDKGSVKTDFIINQPLTLPASAKWLVFEDRVALPEGYHISPGGSAVQTDNGHWSGNLFVQNEKRKMIEYHQPKYYDGYGLGSAGIYDIEKSGDTYSVKVMVPASFLRHASLRYPVYIDPLVTGGDTLGNFSLIPGIDFGAELKFTQETLGSCDYTITVDAPGKCKLTDAYIDLEYQWSENIVPRCAMTPDSVLFCQFADVTMQVDGPCETTNELVCNPAQPPFLGTCTTDPWKVPAARALYYQDFVACVPPQCPDYGTLPLQFTLKNRTKECLEVCDNRCAIGTMFAVTVEGRTIELDVEADKYEVCAEERVRITSKPSWGVPPYNYVWTPTRLTDSISTIYPTVTTTYIDTAFDICGMWAVDSLTIVVKPTPTADAGGNFDRCDGDPSFGIGGNPTGPPNSIARWSASPANAVFYLSDTTSPYPVVNIPIGTTGTFEYIVRVEDNVCFQYDTMVVNVAPKPSPVIIADSLRICEGGVITLAVTQPFTQYQWSTGEMDSSIQVSQSGIYSVSVADASGCTGTANSPQVTVVPPPAFSITALPPSATIEIGGSVTLGADIDLQSSLDYYWLPDAFITCTYCQAPVVTPPSDQLYSLTVVSADSCTFTDSLLIRVVPPESYVIPSAFSPNNDTKNDQFFIIKASGVTVKEFKVFNRWGQLVHDDATPWDGYYQDQLQEMGVYSYLFVLKFFDGRESTEYGSVTLVR